MEVQRSKGAGACSRLGICLCYDKDGIIDDYIPYLLNDLKENLDRLVIVFNGELTPDGRKKLLAVSKDVTERENKGYDAAGWKYAMTEYLGWETVCQYDELVLLNDTFYGPFYPFRNVFARMSGQDVDFWGLTAHGEGRPLYSRLCKKHLQSYFLVIRKNMLGSYEFRQYWEKQKLFGSFQEAVEQNEDLFTEYFSEKGFTWGVLIHTEDLDGKHAMNHYAFNVEELLKRGYPVIKRKTFQESLGMKLEYHNGEDLKKALQYIRQYAAYDISMIWQNILRIYHMSDIHDALDLDYVFPSHAVLQKKLLCRPRAVAVLHMTYTKELEHYKPYIRAVPDWMDVIITTVSADREKLLQEAFTEILGQRLTILKMQNRGRDLAAMLVAAKPYILKYDFFCFCHDKISKQSEYSIGKYFERLLWENTLSSTAYIENILARFEAEPQLGLLTVPSQTGGFVVHFRSKLWTENYKNTMKLLDQLNVHVPVSEADVPLAIGTAFWCRTAALKKLLDYPWSYDDFPQEPMKVDGQINHALERCFPFVVQDAGYYTASAMTQEYAGILINAYKYLAYHQEDQAAAINYMCLTDFNLPDVGIWGALHLLKLTVIRYLKRKRP